MVARGEPRVCSMVPIPDEADEDARRFIRERQNSSRSGSAFVNRIAAVLATLGVRDYNQSHSCATDVKLLRRVALGTALPPQARAKIVRMIDRLELVQAASRRTRSRARRRP